MFKLKKGMSLFLSVIVAVSFAAPVGQAKAACGTVQYYVMDFLYNA